MVGPTLQQRVATNPQLRITEALEMVGAHMHGDLNLMVAQLVQFDGVSRPYSYAGDNWKRFYKTGTTSTNSAVIYWWK